jgi:hypothetical protein
MGPGCISGSAEGGQQAGSSGTSDTGGTGVIGATSEESASASASDPKTGREGWRNQFWKMELGLIEKMLDADARNCEWVVGPGLGEGGGGAGREC